MSEALARAAETMRAVGDRCVWTQQITHRDLVPYLIEETAELIDAIEAHPAEQPGGDPLKEELGDLLWQVLFHADIASRASAGGFDIHDVADALTAKMIRRHPHVFGAATATTSEQVLVLWNAAKASEKAERTSVLDGVSERMPALAWAQKVLERSEHMSPEPVVPTPEVADEDDLGAALLALVALARERGWDAERALRARVRSLQGDIRAQEHRQAG